MSHDRAPPARVSTNFIRTVCLSVFRNISTLPFLCLFDVAPEAIDRLRSEEIVFSSLQDTEPPLSLDVSRQRSTGLASPRAQSWFSWGTWRSNPDSMSTPRAAPASAIHTPSSTTNGLSLAADDVALSGDTDADVDGDAEIPSDVLADPLEVHRSASMPAVQSALPSTDALDNPSKRTRSEILTSARNSIDAATSLGSSASKRPQSADASTATDASCPEGGCLLD